MMKYTHSLNQFDIYLAKVYFSDKPTVYKIRPVVVLGVQNDVVTVLKMTTKNSVDGFEYYPLQDWSHSGLTLPTYVLINPRYEIPIENIYHNRLIGELSEFDINNIIQLLEN